MAEAADGGVGERGVVVAVAPQLLLWRSHDAAWATFALVNNLLPMLIAQYRRGSHWGSALVLGPQVLALQWAFVVLAALQLAWIGLLPSSYSLRRRTAFTVLQRALRLAVFKAVCEDTTLQALIPAALLRSAEGMAPVPAAIKACLGPLRWSLPFIVPTLVLALRHMPPLLATFIAHPRFAPGAQRLCAAACHLVVWISGHDPKAATAPDSPFCRDLTPEWLATFSVLTMGLVVPLYVVHCLYEQKLLPCMLRAVSGGPAVRGDALEAALELVMFHLPLLALALLALVVASSLLMTGAGA